MHLLAAHYRSEFLATPQLVRIDYVMGANGFEPTLLIKGSSLLLKYMVLGVRLEFHLGRVSGRLLYAVTIYDDASKPVMLWSVVESDAEVNALKGLADGETCPIFLFNELAINVSWSTVRCSLHPEAQCWISDAVVGEADYATIEEQVGDLHERVFNGDASIEELYTAQIVVNEPWHPLSNHFITSHGTDSPINLYCKDEGGQQEQLAVWLTDNLQPRGVHHSPQIPKDNGRRELTDILIGYEHGTILIESKALTVFNREALPDRAKLARDVSQHVEKAIRQLRGSIRQVKLGSPITTYSGAPIEIERIEPAHAIVLIPEFTLIEDKAQYGPNLIMDFMKATGGFIHLLDISELLRVVQAAEIISDQSAAVTPLMALDYYLMERAQRTLDTGTLCIQVLLRTHK